MRLIITEKPSVAKTVSAVLGANERGDGFFQGGGCIVSWCIGHLLESAPPDFYDPKYAKWRYSDLPIIPGEWKYIPVKGKEKQLKAVIALMSRPDVECVINACDSGREGELIFRHVYNHAKCTRKMLRLWISSMEENVIKTGFDNLKDGAEYDNLYKAALCRERADWIVGYSATRLFSTLYGVTLNTGRVQSPTLAMLVKREADITDFVKEKFYTPILDLGAFTASGERTSERRQAESIQTNCGGKIASVTSIDRQKKSESPPKLHDLTALQRDANRLFGFTAQQTLEYTQSLYEKAVLSYPRVDSRHITSDMRGTVENLVGWLHDNSPYMNGLSFALDVDRLIDNDKVSDHHAIIPTIGMMKTDLSALPSGERDLINLITARILCATADAHVYEAVTVTIDCNGYTFIAKGKNIISNGWKGIDMAFKSSLKEKPENECSDEDINLPGFYESQIFEHVTASVKEGATSPPKQYSEDTLLSHMEKAGNEEAQPDQEKTGLGTPATRAATIEKLIKTNLIQRKKKNIAATDKGKNLIAVLPKTLISPKLTSEWEFKLKQVEMGRLSENIFMDDIAAFIKKIVAENDTAKLEFAELFVKNSGNAKTNAKSLGSCPRCGFGVREAAKGFFCDSRTCGFKMWKASKFWTSKKKPLTATIVTVLLKDGRIALKGLYSERTGRKYDAIVTIDDTGDYVNYTMSFKK
jgi:DNA topoisomerase-3